MVHIIYGLVCRENFVGDEMCHIVKKVENHRYRLLVNFDIRLLVYFLLLNEFSD
jgi:hypothetical protein